MAKLNPTKKPAFQAEELRKFLTPKRLALWRMVRDQNPASVSGLSRLLGRDQKSVHRDLDVLVSLGIVALRNHPDTSNNALRPISLMDSIRMEVR